MLLYTFLIKLFHLIWFKYMANYHIGLDFGTSQTKSCLFNIDNEEREFVLFENNSFFLPTLITKKKDNTLVYGNEMQEGTKYRYFKMATAEDEELIHSTYENLEGNLLDVYHNYRKYNEKYDIIPEHLSVLYLTYCLLYIKSTKQENNLENNGKKGALARFTSKKENTENVFSIKMGIPTEWSNKKHIKRRLKFEKILIVVSEFSKIFSSLDQFLNKNTEYLIFEIEKISNLHSDKLEHLEIDDQYTYINPIIEKYKVSVYPETAGGLKYLLATKRLTNGYFGAIDIGAGTSDISIFRVNNNKIDWIICSESVEIASNDLYLSMCNDNVDYENIKNIEELYRANNIEPMILKKSLNDIHNKIEFVIRKIYYRKYYMKLMQDSDESQLILNKHTELRIRNFLNNSPIFIYGGGANFPLINEKKYMFFQNSKVDHLDHHNRYLKATRIIDYIDQINIKDRGEVYKNINQLILALGLSYLSAV